MSERVLLRAGKREARRRTHRSVCGKRGVRAFLRLLRWHLLALSWTGVLSCLPSGVQLWRPGDYSSEALRAWNFSNQCGAVFVIFFAQLRVVRGLWGRNICALPRNSPGYQLRAVSRRSHLFSPDRQYNFHQSLCGGICLRGSNDAEFKHSARLSSGILLPQRDNGRFSLLAPVSRGLRVPVGHRARKPLPIPVSSGFLLPLRFCMDGSNEHPSAVARRVFVSRTILRDPNRCDILFEAKNGDSIG